MMKRRNSGFTLIEVLAVIIILGTIVAIAVPAMLERIEKSKQESAKTSVGFYIDALQKASVFPQTVEEEIVIGGTYDITTLNDKVDLDKSYSKPTKGIIVIDDEGIVVSASLCVNNYKVDFLNGKATVDAENTCDNIIGIVEPPVVANAPKLTSNMMPVVYDTGSSSWKKADTATAWYDYDTQNWANSVTVKATGTQTRAYYLAAPAGTVINMADINTMWVWIPRYEYKIDGTYGLGGTSLTVPGEIEVNWIGDTGVTVTPDYRIHSAFTLGTTELSGIWVGKFEISAVALANTVSDNLDTKEVLIKPNVSPWQYCSISNYFKAIRKMELYNNAFGFEQNTTATSLSATDQSIVNDNNLIDTHMIKNNEWGAIAYLSQSKYGKYGNTNFTGANKEIYNNNYNSSNLGITGCSSGTVASAASTTCANTYNISLSGVGASTTGTISGIYDMSGGMFDYVVTAYSNPAKNGAYPAYTGFNSANYSGFNGYLTYTMTVMTGATNWPVSKYFSVLTTTSVATTCGGSQCFGEAMGETTGWYSDGTSSFGSSAWLARGGVFASSSASGIFNYDNTFTGGAATGATTRAVLTVE